MLPGFFGGAAIGDLFGDGNKELVAGAWDHHVSAWNKNGRMLSGFPIHSWDTIWDTPALADLQSKRQLDVVVAFDASGPPDYPKGGTVWLSATGVPGQPVTGQVALPATGLAESDESGSVVLTGDRRPFQQRVDPDHHGQRERNRRSRR
ncbi:MAG: hypothetical protein M3Z57_01715 [Candidatus Dormibacteraeota bacterium]|nr:hypothetical protein [Candidatus Dormibacteraeota bacterium]